MIAENIQRLILALWVIASASAANLNYCNPSYKTSQHEDKMLEYISSLYDGDRTLLKKSSENTSSTSMGYTKTEIPNFRFYRERVGYRMHKYVVFEDDEVYEGLINSFKYHVKLYKANADYFIRPLACFTSEKLKNQQATIYIITEDIPEDFKNEKFDLSGLSRDLRFEVFIKLAHMLEIVHGEFMILNNIDKDNFIYNPTTRQFKYVNFDSCSKTYESYRAENVDYMDLELSEKLSKETGVVKGSADKTSDLWAFGILLMDIYHRNSGYLPKFYELDFKSRIDDQLSSINTKLNSFPLSLDSFVLEYNKINASTIILAGEKNDLISTILMLESLRKVESSVLQFSRDSILTSAKLIGRFLACLKVYDFMEKASYSKNSLDYHYDNLEGLSRLLIAKNSEVSKAADKLHSFVLSSLSGNQELSAIHMWYLKEVFEILKVSLTEGNTISSFDNWIKNYEREDYDWKKPNSPEKNFVNMFESRLPTSETPVFGGKYTERSDSTEPYFRKDSFGSESNSNYSRYSHAGENSNIFERTDSLSVGNRDRKRSESLENKIGKINKQNISSYLRLI
jgi:hypothetical protein